MWAYGRITNRRLGLGPCPFSPPPIPHYKHKYKWQRIMLRTNVRAGWLAQPCQVLCPYPKVMGSNLQESQKISTNLTNTSVPCGSPCMGHVAPNHTLANCHMSSHPHQHQLFLATTVVWLYDLYSQMPHGTIWTVQSSFFFACLEK
jgi:hypothetical protein